jgi:uncharacterized protein (TIGR02145 family)
LTLKGNSVDGVSSGNIVSSQASSSTPLAKQVTATVAINDVIAVTKDGYLNYRCVQYASDTTGLQIKMVASAGTVRDTDGNVYQTVRIGNQVWMTENLRVTKYNDGSTIPFDTSAATWNSAITPKCCFYENTNNSNSINKYGALYNWYIVSSTNPKKIAPAGWHVPSDSEWTILEDYLIAKGYNWDGTTTGNKIAKSLAAKTDWFTYSTTGIIGCDLTMNNSSGFSALPGGYRSYSGTFYSQSYYGNWWTATEYDASNAYFRNLFYVNYFLYRYYGSLKSCGYSVRLVRD